MSNYIKIIICSLLAVNLTGCFLFSQEQRKYSNNEVCNGIKRQIIYNSHNPNITPDFKAINQRNLQQKYNDNNCQAE